MADAKRVDLEPDVDIGADATHGYSFPARYYLDPDIYEREKEAIFYRNWNYIGHVTHFEKPGDYLTLRIGDENIFVIRDREGNLNGFYNICRHRAHELLEGAGNAKLIVCPYHAWTYETDGQLRGAPNASEVEGFEKSKFCLKPIRVETFCGFVYVNLDLDAVPLTEQAEGLEADIRKHLPNIEDFRPIETFEFIGGGGIKANWKVVVDNNLECYHCTAAHPAFSDMFDMSSYELETKSTWSRQLGPVVNPDNRAYQFEPGSNFQYGFFYNIWPNSTINLMPGSGNLTNLSIVPVDHETTIFVGHRYGLNGETKDTKAAGSYLNEILGPEDAGICESVQRGLRSRSYNQGRFIVDPGKCGIAEHAVHHFHQMVMEALEN